MIIPRHSFPQKFQEEVGDVSLVSLLLGADASDPNIGEKTSNEVKDVGARWKTAWNWSEDHKNKMIAALANWQEFRDEELVMLNWLAQKEKMLKEVLEVDVADEEQVNEQLGRLEVRKERTKSRR